MAQLGQAFDHKDHEEMREIGAVPAGEYLSKIVKSEIRENNNKNGKYINYEFDIIQGEFKGRKFWALINIIHPNPITIEIAEREHAAITRACFLGSIKDTNEAHGIPMMVKLKFVPENKEKGYAAKNQPTRYSPAPGATQQPTNKKVVDDSDDIPW